jgi:hypothetical protein
MSWKLSAWLRKGWIAYERIGRGVCDVHVRGIVVSVVAVPRLDRLWYPSNTIRIGIIRPGLSIGSCIHDAS